MTFFLSVAMRRLLIYGFVCSHVSLFGAAAGIPNLLPADESLPEEGFLWKRSLTVEQGERDPISFENTHAELYRQLNGFQMALDAIQNPVDFVQRIILNRHCLPKIHTVFRALYEDGVSIDRILGSGEINVGLFENDRIQRIIRGNFRRLKGRNFCIASFNYVPEDGERVSVPLVLERSQKPIIFISGLGNEIIRILELSPLFCHSFSFVIFHEKRTNSDSISIEHFEKILRALYINVIPRLEDEVVEKYKLKKYKGEVLKLDGSRKKIQEIKNKATQVVTDYFSEDADEIEVTTQLCRIPHDLIITKENYREAFLAFLDKFCDSEQALRYFLYTHIERFLTPLPLTLQGILTLNIHSRMDPCKHCTNALFFESLLRNQPSFSIGKSSLDVGFFQKFYNIQQSKTEAERKPMPNNIFILVSSQKPETNGGLPRRLTSGRNYPDGDREGTPIQLDSPVRLYFRYNGPFPAAESAAAGAGAGGGLIS